MKNYLYSIVAVSVASSLFRALCPNNVSLKKYFSFLTSAVLLCATVLPISSLVSGIQVGSELFSAVERTEDYNAIWAEQLSSRTQKETERAVLAHICEKFGISDKNVQVSCTFSEEEGGLRLTAVDITLSRGALLKNPRQIESYAEQSFGVPCCVSDGSILTSE